ncbi:MAG: hypothetical protein RMI63_02995 [Caldimicrobium sp.]|nr:hypothetical protein [Caldimicrobium sp.]
MYKTQENKSIEEHLNELEEMVRSSQNIEADSFLKLEKQLRKLTDRFISILEYAVENQGFAVKAVKKDSAEQDKDDELYKYNALQALLYRLKAQNVSRLMDDISREGYRLRDRLGEAFEKSAYRILELTRAGRRSDVFYNIVRIFIARGVNMPPKLQEVFKPYYDLQTFQALIYAFLVSILKEDKNQNQEESYE